MFLLFNGGVFQTVFVHLLVVSCYCWLLYDSYMKFQSVVVQEVKFRRFNIDLIRFITAAYVVLGHCFLLYLAPTCLLCSLFPGMPTIYRAVDPFTICWALTVFVSILGYLAMYNSSPSDSSPNCFSFVKKKIL